MAEGVDAGAACSNRVKSETITRAAFRLPKLSAAPPGESRPDRASLHHEHRARPVGRGPVAELAVAALAPAVRRDCRNEPRAPPGESRLIRLTPLRLLLGRRGHDEPAEEAVLLAVGARREEEGIHRPAGGGAAAE